MKRPRSCKYNHLFEILDYKLSPPTSVIDNVRNLDGKDSIFIEDVDKFKKIIHDFYDDKNEPRISLKNVTIHDQKEFDATESKQVSHKYNVHWMVHNALEGIKNTVGEDYYHCIIKSRSDMILSPNYRFTEILKLTCTRIVGTHKVLFTDWMQSSIRNMPSKENQFLYHCEDSCFGGNASSMFLMYNNFLEKVKKKINNELNPEHLLLVDNSYLHNKHKSFVSNKFYLKMIIESKKLMKFCELPWDKKCLEYYKRKDLISKTSSNDLLPKASCSL